MLRYLLVVILILVLIEIIKDNVNYNNDYECDPEECKYCPFPNQGCSHMKSNINKEKK